MQGGSGDYQASQSYYGSTAQPYNNSGSMYNVAPVQAVQCMPNRVDDTQELRGEADGVRFRILYRDVNTIVECQLQPNACINIAAGYVFLLFFVINLLFFIM